MPSHIVRSEIVGFNRNLHTDFVGTKFKFTVCMPLNDHMLGIPYTLHFCALALLVGRQEGIWPVKN